MIMKIQHFVCKKNILNHCFLVDWTRIRCECNSTVWGFSSSINEISRLLCYNIDKVKVFDVFFENKVIIVDCIAVKRKLNQEQHCISVDRFWAMLGRNPCSEFIYHIAGKINVSILHVFNRYNVVFMVLTYFLPIIAMTYAYTRVGVELWGSQSIGECTQRQLDNVKSKRRVSWIFANLTIKY